jgi:hypothetical protein
MTIKRVLVSFLIFMVVTATTAYALNKILVAKGTALLFADSAQTEDVTITLSALAALSGCTTGCNRCSARYQKTGANVKSQRWEMRPHIQLTGTNSLSDVVEFYISTSDGTNAQGGIGTGDAAFDINVKKAFTFVGVLPVYQTNTNTTMTVAFTDIVINEAYFSVCVSNTSTLPFKTDTAVHGITMTPMDIEIQ